MDSSPVGGDCVVSLGNKKQLPSQCFSPHRIMKRIDKVAREKLISCWNECCTKLASHSKGSHDTVHE